MRDAVQHARHELLVFLDGDLHGLRPGIVSDLCRPLWADQADFVKARFGRASGRVTELTAKPMLKVFFPELAHFAQPLGGLIAARRSLLQTLEMEDGYGVDVGLLLDAHRAGARLTEVDIGGLEHTSQPLHDLTAMANEVSRVIYNRARAAGRLHVEQISNMFEAQRQATATLEHALSRRRGQRWLMLLDLDGSVAPGHFVQALAHSAGQTAALNGWLHAADSSASPVNTNNPLAQAQSRQEHIAMLFRFMHRRQIEQVAREMPLRPGIVALVNQLRRAGFMVGVLSDGYFVAADIIRRRIFADFCLAHSLVFDGDVCSGQWRCNPAFVAPAASAGPALCKGQVLQRLRDDARANDRPWAQIWALGDDQADLGLLSGADRAFALAGAPPAVMRLPGVQAIDSFDDMLQQLPAWLPAAAVQA
jgi:glucosyl-3-phosphoglycerate synthase